MSEKARHPGIAVRHRKRCASHHQRACSCRPSYQAQVWSPRDDTPIRRSFPTLAAARAWRAEAQVAVRRGQLGLGSQLTVRDAAQAFIAGARAGTIRNRSGDPYKPSVIRGYETSLRLRVVPALGGAKLTAISRIDLQRLVDRLLAQGLDPSSVRNALMPLRAIYRRAHARGEVAVNPTRGLELPAPRGRRDRVATPAEAEMLIGALEPADRAVWASALYAGLRRGELRGLRWEDIDLDAGLIHVRRGWDAKEGPIEAKTRSGRRTVPLPARLGVLLREHRLRQAGGGEGWVFTNRAGQPFDPSVLIDRARLAWKAAGLQPIGLHECRHTYASLMIAAGANLKALSTYLGHASITITLDRYGHMLPGNENEAADIFERYLLAAGR